MTLRSRIFVIISLIVLFVLGVSLLLVVRANKKKSAPETSSPSSGYSNETANQRGANVSPQNQGATAPVVKETPRAPTLGSLQNSVKQYARVFIERYATYSSDNNFQNIKEAQSMVTPELWARISKKIDSRSAGGFIGVTVRVVAAEMKNWSGDRAEVEMRLIKNEEKDGVSSTVYSEANVWVVKTGDKWLVEKFDLR